MLARTSAAAQLGLKGLLGPAGRVRHLLRPARTSRVAHRWGRRGLRPRCRSGIKSRSALPQAYDSSVLFMIVTVAVWEEVA